MAATGDGSVTTSPPSGPGSAPGLGEAFRMNLNTGQGVYSYKIALPDGVAAFKPDLSLEYSHGTRLDAFGLGWRLALRSIEQRLDLGVTPSGEHQTFLDGDQEIVELQNGAFGALNESAFSRYTRVGAGWRIEERTGLVHDLGASAATRVTDPGDPARVQIWLIEKSSDVSGNAIAYSWDTTDGIPYPTEIKYAAYAVRFAYEERPDVRLDGRAGFLRRRRKRCVRIGLFLDPGPGEQQLRAWSLSYDTSAASGVSLLASIQLTSFDPTSAHGGDVVRAPVRFTYSSFDPRDCSVGYVEAQAGSPPPLTNPNAALVNLDQAPLPGVLQTIEGAQYYWRNTGLSWAPPEALGRTPYSGSFAAAGVAFADMNGNGKPDLMLLAPGSRQAGYYENAGQKGWGHFVAYPRDRRATPEWLSPHLRLADNDNDGRIDAIVSSARGFVVWRNEGDQGWADPTFVPRTAVQHAPEVDFANPLIALADMTGDGTSDLVEIGSGRIQYWPSLGNGSYGEGVIMQNCPRLPDLHRHPDRVFLVDIDSDGCADLVYFTGTTVLVAQNRNGSSFADASSLENIPPAIPGTIRVSNLAGTAAAGFTWNSYRRAADTAYVHLEFGVSAAPYLLSTVDNGSGLLSELWYRSAVEDYRRDRDNGVLWDTNFPFPMLVVARTRETDRVTKQVTDTRYEYHNGHYEPHGRRFEGFRWTDRIEKGDESRSDTRTSFDFLMAMELQPGNGVEHAALNGALARATVYALDGSPAQGLPLSTEGSEYEVTSLTDATDGRKRAFVQVKVHRTLDGERTLDVRGEEKTYTYDAVGNVTTEVHRGFGTRNGVAQPELRRTTETQYAKSHSHYLLGKHSSVVVRDGAGTILSETRFFYDGSDFNGLPLGQADRGLLTRQTALAMSTADYTAHFDASMDGATVLGFVDDADRDGVPSRFVQQERHAYDARGLRVASLDALGAQSKFTYDASGLFRTLLSTPLGDTKFEFDRSAGQPVGITYPNGAVFRFTYDAQGRVKSTAAAGEDPSKPARSFVYDDSSVPNVRVARMRPAPDTASDIVTYFDARGNELQQRVRMDDATYVISGRRLFNPWGDVKQEFQPTFSGSREFSLAETAGASSRTVEYDARGRPVRTVNYNGGVSTATYTPFAIELSDANDNDLSAANAARGQVSTPRREEFDVFRQRSAVVEVLGGGTTMTTTFVNDGQGRAVEIRDQLGVICSYTFDRLGNRYDFNHRAAGHRRLWYDARGKVVRSLDANGNDLRVCMDALGRIRTLSSAGNVLEDYTYDAGASEAGKIAHITYRGGSQAFAYDSAGRVTRNTMTFEGGSGPYAIAYEYDGLGRQTAETHSDGVRIEKKLLLNGWIKSITGIVPDITYDPRGLPKTITFANGVKTAFGYLDGPGRVNTQKTTGPQGEIYEDLTYSFDPMGLMLNSNDLAPGGRGSAALAYDPLYQLTSCATTRGGATTNETYDYVNHLNLAGFGETGSTFRYDDVAHPDRLVGITRTGSPREDLGYDANGNLLNLEGKTFTYNEKNELARCAVAGGVTADYAYDPQGQRTSKRVTDAHGLDQRTFFAGPAVEIRDGNVTHFVRLGERRMAVLSGGTTRFVHSDYAGSTAFFTDQNGVRISAIAYRPFGNVAQSSGAIDTRTFSVHPFDVESGLYYMLRRYYSPDIGRFLTPDPLSVYQPERVLGSAKTIHPYIYVGNDPLNNYDRDGLSFWSVVGAIVGVIAAVALAVAVVATGGALGVVLLAVGLAIGLVTVSYAIASSNRGNGVGEFFRGFMIGFNAGLNAVLATALFGPVVGIALGVINFLAAFDGIAGNRIYQGILGWSSWLMPMSWLATAVGLLFFVINIVVAGVTFQQWDAAKIDKISIHWETGAIVIRGGLIHPAGGATGFNLGNFAFLDASGSAEEHETGHGLNVAAFGSIFHFVAAIDQNVLGSGRGTYSEVLAESHDPAKADPTQWWDMWDPRHA